MWTYDQSSGELRNAKGEVVSRGYSGKDRGKNNPKLQDLVGLGPIPRGRWKMTAVYNSKNVGPFAIRLEAVDATPGDDRHDETGRGAFRIHGDSIRAPGTASRGCIILPRIVRERLWNSRDREIEVVA